MEPEENLNERMQALLNCLSTTSDNEADCLEFGMQSDCLAELLAAGANGDVVIPQDIKAHLLNSRDCREEFEALIAVLKAELAGELPDNFD